jgi:hypothetical protein
MPTPGDHIDEELFNACTDIAMGDGSIAKNLDLQMA